MTEKRLIDVNKVINAMQKCLDEDPDTKYSAAYFVFKSIIELLNQEPTVDAVEVVRCKDCKCWDSKTGFCNKHSRFYHGGLDWDMFNDDDFCSVGERKSNGES